MTEHLIVVLPGIGGSVLTDPGSAGGVWTAGLWNIAGTVVRASRLSIAENPTLVPTGLITSKTFLGFSVIAGYEALLNKLAVFGKLDSGDPRNPPMDADVVAVPYDWRRGIQHAAEHLDSVVTARLAGLSDRERLSRVIVVAHSLGGLVARYWLGIMGRSPWCRALLTMATPHRGAPKALDWLVNGVRVGPLRLVGMSDLIWDLDSIPQLLPTYRAVLDISDPAAEPIPRYPHEIPVDRLDGRAKTARQLHKDIEQSWLGMTGQRPEFTPYLGWSHPTLDAAKWTGRTLTVEKKPCDWLGLRGWDQELGDGTVPSYSAIPPDLDNTIATAVRQQQVHARLTVCDDLIARLSRYEKYGPPRHVHGAGDEEHPPTLGVDIDELNAANHPIPIVITIPGTVTDLSGVTVRARLTPHIPTGAPARGGVTVPWDSSTASFRTTLPAFDPGLYTLRIVARRIPGSGDLDTAADIAVIDPDSYEASGGSGG